MDTFISNSNALDPAQNVTYRRGTVTKTDYINNLLSVTCGGDSFSNIPPFYSCEKNGGHTTLAFSIGDDVMVRFSGNQAQYVTGFYGALWPCVPMPSFTLVSDGRMFSSSMFQDTGLIESDETLFLKRYKEIATSACDAVVYKYKNVTPPDDFTGVFAAVEQDGSIAGSSYRDTTLIYDNKFIYRTYNSETNTTGIFNGTRSNILGSYINPDTGIGTMVYQINTFTNWDPQTSGRVDFAFYIYSSAGYHEQVAGGYSIITGDTSTAYGNGIFLSEGLCTGEEGAGHLFCLKAEIYTVPTFSAPNSTNVVDYGYQTSEIYLTSFADSDGLKENIKTFDTNRHGWFLLPDGSYSYTDVSFYKKI